MADQIGSKTRPGWVKDSKGKLVRLADMSAPPEERGRKRRTTRKTTKRKTAQMDHGGGGKGQRRAREGRKRLDRERTGDKH